jgi:phospholipase C
MNRFSRRSFLAGLSAAAPLAASSRLNALSQISDSSSPALPSPNASGIEHVVLVMMENRSFDHFLGWLPNANTKQKNEYPNTSGHLVSTYHLTNPQNCNFADPDHSYAVAARNSITASATDG